MIPHTKILNHKTQTLHDSAQGSCSLVSTGDAKKELALQQRTRNF